MDDEFVTWLGEVRARLREKRVALGLSFRVASERTGVPFTTIGRVETGKVAPTLEVLFRLARGYGMTPQEALFGPPDVSPAKASRNGKR